MLGFALAVIGAVSSVAMTLAGIDGRAALVVAVCGALVCALASRAPRWWP
jgi:hypothetical protein